MIEYRVFTEADLFDIPEARPYRDGYRVRIQIGKDTITKKYKYQSFFSKDDLNCKVQARDYIEKRISGQEEQRIYNELLTTEIENWLYNVKRKLVYEDYFDRLEETYKGQIKPYIIGVPIDKATPDICRKIMNGTLNSGYAYSTIKKVHSFLKQFFEYMLDEDKIAKNPMRTVKMFNKKAVESILAQIRAEREKAKEKYEKGEKLTDRELYLINSNLKMIAQKDVKPLSNVDIKKIKDVVENGYQIKWQSENGKDCVGPQQYIKQAEFFIFLMNCGLRAGEAISLKYSDVDFKNKTINIQRNTVREKKRDVNGFAIGGSIRVERSTKTRASEATIRINDTAIEILKKMKAKEKKGYNEYIVNDEGKQINDSALRKRFYNLQRQAGTEHYGLHALRHTFATKLAEHSGNNDVVKKLARHKNISTTELYIDSSDEFIAQQLKGFSV